MGEMNANLRTTVDDLSHKIKQNEKLIKLSSDIITSHRNKIEETQ